MKHRKPKGLNDLQKCIRLMSNWQNSQWLQHAKNLNDINEAASFMVLKRR